LSSGGERDEDGPHELDPGDCIAERYHLAKLLGKGSFGQVWAAHDAITRQLVAVKLLFSHVELAPARAQMEVAALRLRLPGVVELKDNGVHGRRAFLVMELVDGAPFPGKPGPCSWDEISAVTVALLETLARVHDAFIVHRDLKPENVLVSPAGRVYLLDFGIAYQQSAISIDTAR
jgi:eukaryotic-like serine/threonine-protein kinase